MLKKIFRNDLPMFVPMITIMLSAYHMVGSALSLRLLLPIDTTYSNSLYAVSNTNPLILVYLIGLTVTDFVIMSIGVLILAYREHSSEESKIS